MWKNEISRYMYSNWISKWFLYSNFSVPHEAKIILTSKNATWCWQWALPVTAIIPWPFAEVNIFESVLSHNWLYIVEEFQTPTYNTFCDMKCDRQTDRKRCNMHRWAQKGRTPHHPSLCIKWSMRMAYRAARDRTPCIWDCRLIPLPSLWYDLEIRLPRIQLKMEFHKRQFWMIASNLSCVDIQVTNPSGLQAIAMKLKFDTSKLFNLPSPPGFLWFAIDRLFCSQSLG